jgi:SWI/SNF-related matrix-associated actin-dependent regulator 1 of chromatin subfamily A
MSIDSNIPEHKALSILKEYSGANNYILQMKKNIFNNVRWKMGTGQRDYILNHSDTTPKVAKKWVEIDSYFAEQLQENRLLTYKPTKIYIEKLLVQTNKAYHVFGKVFSADTLNCFWVPKSQIVADTSKPIDVDYTPFEHRQPFTHQKEAIEKLVANEKYILADDMGLGKTTSAIISSIVKDFKKILIICPASLKINWKREIQNYSDSEVSLVEGKKWSSSKFIIINYDILKNFHSIPNKKDDEVESVILNENFDLIIIDEAHYVSNSKAQRTKIVNDICKKTKHVWLLTGTPMTSRPINYYNILKLVGSRVSTNWRSYVLRYCEGRQFRAHGGRKVWNVNGASNLEELRDRTNNKVLRRLKEDVLDLPDKIITPIYLELKSKDYEREVGEYLDWTNRNSNQSLTVHLSKLTKIRQILAWDKLEYTCELIDQAIEQEKKVIVFCNFTAPLLELGNRYEKNSVLLYGQMNKEDRQKSVDAFQNDPDTKIFISNIKAGGLGITLTAAEAVIMNDLSFVPSDHSQAEDRAFRIGQKKNVSCFYPLFDNTIERVIYNILASKKRVIDTVMGDNISEEDIFSEILSEIHSL